MSSPYLPFMFEKETIELYRKVKELGDKNKDKWIHSPIENWKIDWWPKNFNEFNLANFRRTAISDGMISFPDRPLKYKRSISESWLKGIPFWQKIRGVRDIWVTMKRLRTFFKFGLSDINDNLVGNPCYYRLGKYHITDSALRSYFYNKYIHKSFGDVKSILEIGGGFGGLCLKIISNIRVYNVWDGIFKPNINYILVELPEILVLAWYYLKNNKIEVSIITEDKDLEAAKGILLVAPWMLSKINRPIDLLVNTMSFQHMTKDNLDYYFKEVNRLKVRNLFLVNGEERPLPETGFKDYPLKGYVLLNQEKYPFSEHIMRIYKRYD